MNRFRSVSYTHLCEGIIKYYKKQNKIPSENVLKEVIKELLEGKQYADLVTKDDIPNINTYMTSSIYIKQLGCLVYF